MQVHISSNADETGKAAAAAAANAIREAIESKGQANIILATGTSQFQTLNQLVSEPGIEWNKVVMFHLDEYVGLPITHPASFRKYLKERFLEKISPVKSAFLIDGEHDPQQECERLGTLITIHPIDVAMVGIGENGHLAFNDPPADFETEQPYIIVVLDQQSRKQQLGEGWFPSLQDVPHEAISMSIRQIMKSKHIICTVPDERKAIAVKNSVENEVSNLYPASVLQRHPSCTCYLDYFSAALLSRG